MRISRSIAASDTGSSSIASASRRLTKTPIVVAAIAIAATALAAPASVQPVERCVRIIEPSDVFFQLRGNELSIVTTNLTGTCDIIHLRRMPGGPRGDIVGGRYAFGEDTATGQAAWQQQWLGRVSPAARNNRPPESVLAPGSAVVQRTNMLSVARELEKRARAEGAPSLPWGQKVTVRVELFAEFMAPDEPEVFVRGPQPQMRGIESPPLIYQLPPKPPTK